MKKVAALFQESLYCVAMNEKTRDGAIGSHVLPFAVWMALMVVPGLPAAWNYALRGAVCFALFLRLRPWDGYEPLKSRNLPPALLVGVAVFVAWVLPESSWAGRWPGLQDFYLRWAVMPLGKLPEPLTVFPFAPETRGWLFSLTRLAGSVFVIAIIEEFFWRGLIYRRLIEKNFMKVNLGTLRWLPAFTAAVLFGFEHDRWLAGIAAGLAYTLLMILARNIWAAIVAHMVTNFLLGVYVLTTGAYRFW